MTCTVYVSLPLSDESIVMIWQLFFWHTHLESWLKSRSHLQYTAQLAQSSFSSLPHNKVWSKLAHYTFGTESYAIPYPPPFHTFPSPLIRVTLAHTLPRSHSHQFWPEDHTRNNVSTHEWSEQQQQHKKNKVVGDNKQNFGLSCNRNFWRKNSVRRISCSGRPVNTSVMSLQLIRSRYVDAFTAKGFLHF